MLCELSPFRLRAPLEPLQALQSNTADAKINRNREGLMKKNLEKAKNFKWKC